MAVAQGASNYMGPRIPCPKNLSSPQGLASLREWARLLWH